MKKNYLNVIGWILVWIIILIPASLNAQTVVTFPYTGAVQYFTVPSCVGTITVNVRGAQGTAGTSAAGLGGAAQGVMSVNAGQVLHIYVGGQAGFNGGGAGVAPGGSGGGASDIRFAPGTLNDRVIVAGGGGGGGATNANAPGGGGGAGTAVGSNFFGGGPGIGANSQGPPVGGTAGGASGGNGGVGNGSNNGGAGGGGGFSSGGAGGTNPNYLPGLAGALGVGGAAGGPTGPGGGGGGYYGGGGASGGVNSNAGGGGGSSWTSTLTTPSFTPSTVTGNGVVTLTYNTNGSGVVASAIPTVICTGSTTTLTGNGMISYTWSPGGSNASSIVVNPASNAIYTVQGLNSFGCLSTAEITIVVNQAVPSLTVANTGSLGVCAGKPATLTASGALSYTWAGGVGPANGVGFTPAATADYTVSGSNACGTTNAVATITVNALPNIGGAANNPTVCFGTQVILNGTGSAGGYTWTSGFPNNTAFTPPVGLNSYTVTGAGANTCTNTAVVSVTVYQTPTVTPVATPTAICVGKTATLSAVGATNGYTWSTTPAIFTSTAAVAPVVTTTYSVIRASSSCTSIATVTVVVNPLPNLLVGAPNPSVACAGNCATVTGQGAITYTWYPGGFQGGVITVCPNSSTNYTVVASNANCTTSATSSLTVLPNPVITVNSSTSTVCAGSPVTMTASGASTYTWGSAIPVAQQNQTVVTSSPLTPTLYTVSGTDANGCTSVGNQVILTQTAPNLTTSIVNTGSFICAGQVGTLVAVGNNPVNYNWINTGASAGTTTVNPAVTTVYTVTGTNPNNGCTSTSTLSLAVYISTFVATSPTAICRGNTATLSVAGAANTYSWSAGTPNNNDSIFVSPQNTITYYVTGMTGNCTTTQSINLVVNPIPPVTGVAQKITICRFEPAVLLGSGASDYVWTGGAGATTPNYTVFPQITTTYTLTGTDVNGCSKTVQVTQLVATCIGIEEQSNLAGMLNIYPNPSKGEFTVQSDIAMQVCIVNELGQTVNAFALDRKETIVNISHLANGIYFIRVEKDGNSGTRKIIVEK